MLWYAPVPRTTTPSVSTNGLLSLVMSTTGSGVRCASLTQQASATPPARRISNGIAPVQPSSPPRLT
jgi:hypothetical protein